jgi:Big-like domain-containing protein
MVDNSAGSTSYTENDPATPIDSAVTVTDLDLGATITGSTVQITGGYAGAEDILALASPGSHPGITPSVSGDTLTLSGNASPAAYQAALRDVTYRNSSDSPSTAARTITFTVTDETARSGSDTKGVTVIAVDDPPTAVNDSATVLEDAAATSIPVLTNDTDVDGGPKTISSASDPANGTVVLTGGSPGAHTGLTYQPDPNYCNDPPGTTPDTFTYTLNGGSSATVSITVTCVNDAPVADDETFSGANGAIGNTALIVNDPDDGAPAPSHPKKTISGDILAGDTDIDGPGPLTVTPGTFATNDGGSVTIESDGDFTFHPAASTSCTDASDFFTYTVEDSGSPEQTDTGQVTIAIAGCVWYVSNNAAGNSGTSSAPFDTLVQAETASGANHTVFVFDGDNTSTGYGGDGYAMNAGERLIGEHEGLQVDPDGGGGLGTDTLHPANAGAHPTLTATNADVIDLDDGNELRGLNVDPQGTGGGIAGGAGDTGGGTIDDVNIVDVGTAGTQAGLELNGTTGTFNVTNLVVNNQATGVLLANAGTTDFGSTTITSTGAPGLSATGTNMGTSTFDAITSSNSTTGGVSLDAMTGTTVFGDGTATDLSLTTTSGSQAAFRLNNAGTVTVAAAGTDDVSATGGPAVDVTATSGPTLEFDAVSSTNSTNDGINLAGLGTGTFSAASGAIGGAAGIAFDVDGGSGAVTYPGALNNGSGQTAEVTGRTGGAVTLSGAIADTNDAGGGISLSGNTGGSTTFSNASKVLNTTTGTAVSFTSSDGHTLDLTGGGLDIDTTAGAGINAVTSGTLNVTGSSNTIDTTTGTALNVTDTDVGASPLAFQRISANGASKGIQLSNTGSNSALTVSGSGGTCTNANTTGCSGGAIQNTTGADDSGPTPSGTGIVLNNTRGVSLTRMHIHDHSNYGIRGNSVVGLTIADSVINGTNGTSTLTEHRDSAARFTELTGTVSVTNTDLAGGQFSNLEVINTTGALNATLTQVDSLAMNQNVGASNAVMFEGIETADINVTFQNGSVTSARGQMFHFIGGGTGGGDLTLTGNTLHNGNALANQSTGGGAVSAVAAARGASTLNITNNSIRGAKTNALTVIKSRQLGGVTTNPMTATISGNTIGLTGAANSGSSEGDGMEITTFGQGNAMFNVTNNVIRQYNSSGIQFVAGGGIAESGQFNLNVSGNTVAEPGNNPLITLFQGIRVDSGVDPGDTFQTCIKFGANSITGSSDAANKDFRLVANGNTILRQPGYAGANTDGTAFASYAASLIGGGAQGTAVANPGGTFSGAGTTCP